MFTSHEQLNSKSAVLSKAHALTMGEIIMVLIILDYGRSNSTTISHIIEYEATHLFGGCY